jgi:5-methylcytosine-specific restriction endonuclease McrA
VDEEPTVGYRNLRNRWTKDNVVQRNLRGQTFGNRRRALPNCNNDITDRGLRRELRLGSRDVFYEALGQTLELEIVKRAVGISMRSRKVSDWTLWRGRPPPKRRRDIETQPSEKRTMMVHLEGLASSEGTSRDKRP